MLGRLPACLEVWEIDPRHEPLLRKNLPGAKIKIADAFEEIKVVRAEYDLIVGDNPLATCGGQYEHLAPSPHLFRAAKESALLILDVIPEAPPSALRGSSYFFNKEELELRRQFYRPTTLRGSHGMKCSQRTKIGLGT